MIDCFPRNRGSPSKLSQFCRAVTCINKKPKTLYGILSDFIALPRVNTWVRVPQRLRIDSRASF